MENKGCVYHTLISEYDGDITKNCGLNINELDGNFYFLRGSDVKNIVTNEEKTLLTISFVNGSQIEVPISQDFASLNSQIETIIDDVENLNEEKVAIEGEITNLYEQLGFDENNKFVTCKINTETNEQECTYYINDCETVNEAILVLDEKLASIDGYYAEDINNLDIKLEIINDKLNILDSHSNSIEELQKDEVIIKQLITEEIEARIKNDSKIESKVQENHDKTQDEFTILKKEINSQKEKIDEMSSEFLILSNIIKGYELAIKGLQTENAELKQMINNFKTEVKNEIISNDVFESVGDEMIVEVENGKVKIGFAQTLFLGV